MRNSPESARIVVDASVVIKWQFDDEEYIYQARLLRTDVYLKGIFKLIAPPLLIYEVSNGIIVATRMKRLAENRAQEMMRIFLALEVDIREADLLLIFNLALKYNLTAYDAAYLALAQTEQCDLWTGDRTFYRAVIGQISRIKWIGDYPSKS
jgi:predicted nucleic acid-binding protein